FAQNRSSEIELLTFEGAQKFKLKKEAGVWKIIEPFKDDADATEIDKVLSEIYGLRATVLDTGGGPVAREKNGLTHPDETITLTDGKGQTNVIKIGRVRTYDKGFYLRRGDEPKLIVAATTMSTIYNNAVDSLRNKKLGLPTSNLLSVNVNSHL